MNKRVLAAINYSLEKKNVLDRLVFVLQRIQKSHNLKNTSITFGRLQICRKAQLSKFSIIEIIRTRLFQQAFMDLKSHQKKRLYKQKDFTSQKNLAFSVVAKFLKRNQIQLKYQFFHKILKFNFQKSGLLVQNIIGLCEIFKKRVLLGRAMQTLKNLSANQRKKVKFFRTLEFYIESISRGYMQQSFFLILKEKFYRSQISNMKYRQQKILEQKNFNFNRNEKIRSLRTQIQNLSRALQAQQTVRNKTNKQDYEKNLILQAKNSQINRSIMEFDRTNFQNQALQFQLTKKQGYLRLREQEKNIEKDSQINWYKFYEFLKSQKTKDSFGLKEITIIMYRNGVDMAQSLKRFSLSKDNSMIENIDLKNMVNLFQKQMSGFGVSVNIKESQTYKRTMEQNLNLRQVLQVFLFTILQAEEKQMSATRGELIALVENQDSSQKGSKLMLTTVSTSPF